MRGAGALALIAAVGGLVAGCGGDGTEPRPGQAAEAALELPEPYEAREWSADTDPLVDVEGRLTLDGEPVAGARIKVDDYRLWAATDDDGRFRYPLDITLPRRHLVSVVGAEDATVDGEELSSEQLAVLEATRGSITAGHQLDEIAAAPSSDGGIAVTGRVTLGGEPAKPVTLTAYELTGTVLDASGRPVEDAIVSTRTTDRDFWTFSEPSDAKGRYRSNFAASDRLGSDPVPITVHVAVGDDAYAFLPEETVLFERLKSAEMDIRLPPQGFPLALPEPRSYPGARYKGVLVGAIANGRPLRPVRATWPDEEGRFELVLPASLAGTTVSLWAGELELFSRQTARPGGPVERWPRKLPTHLPRDLARVDLPTE
jgi:hypothetical protein